MADSKKVNLSIKLPQILKVNVHNYSNTDRRDRHPSTNKNTKLTLSQVPDRLSKRYELQKEIRRKDISAAKIPQNAKPITSLRSQVAIQAKKHVKQASNVELAMRESKLLLFKNMEHTKKKKNLGYLLDFKSPPEKQPMIYNRSKRTQKHMPKIGVSRQAIQNPQLPCRYENADKLQQLDFLKLFILEQLIYYLSQSNNRSKEEMLGFCRIYLENSDKINAVLLPMVFVRREEVEMALLLEKLGLYVILLLSTDLHGEELLSQLKSLCSYLHSSNLIILDLLMSIAQIEQVSCCNQFHVFNTMRFNQQRRKINYQTDAIDLLSKNSRIIQDLLQSIVKDCAFESLRNFVLEIFTSKAEYEDKYEEVMFVLMSLEQIMSTSIKSQEVAKPEPPFLPPTTKPYTLVLDLDQTLIHYREVDSNQSFLVRPFCHQFLEEMAQYYQIVIFTASVKQYADTILDIIDKKGAISHRLYRQHTRLEEYVSIKDLSLLGRDLSKTIIVDNIPSNFKLQPRNGIFITTWTGEQGDCCLLNLMPVLQILVKKSVADVRVGLQQISRYMQEKLEKSEPVDLQQVIFN